MTQIGFLEFWHFTRRERHHLWLFLKWTGEWSGTRGRKARMSGE